MAEGNLLIPKPRMNRASFNPPPARWPRETAASQYTTEAFVCFNPPPARWPRETPLSPVAWGERTVSTRPRPDGRGKRQQYLCCMEAVGVSTRPRPDGRGKQPSWQPLTRQYLARAHPRTRVGLGARNSKTILAHPHNSLSFPYLDQSAKPRHKRHHFWFAIANFFSSYPRSQDRLSSNNQRPLQIGRRTAAMMFDPRVRFQEIEP